ncbi:integrase, catalytic region, zinc finger, CCHC-type containing protein [Tanacetum coccineum]
MSRMQEDIQYAGSDTRPPMLDRTDFESWQQRIRLYCLGKDNGENIMKSIKEGPFQMGTVSDVITGGTEGAVQQGPVRARVLNDLSAEEKERYKADIRLQPVFLLQGIPKDIYHLINHDTDAKDIWEKCEMMLEGSELTKEPACQDGEVAVRYPWKITNATNQGRPFQRNNARGNGVAGNVGAPNRGGMINPGQVKPIKCYNCNGLGHIARECPRPKRLQDSNYFKDKMLLMQAQENGAVLDEEQSLFLAGEQVTNVDDDVDDSTENDLALNVDHIFEADECDAFDSDVDEGPISQTMFMASLTSEDPIYDEAGPSYDSNNPLEVLDHDAFVDHMDEYHDVHEMQNDVQHNYVVDSDADYTSDSNIIPALMSILDEMHEQGVQSRLTNKPDMLMNDSVTSELARYKELVGEYEKRAKFELTDRERKIDEQMRIIISDRNRKVLKSELHSAQILLSSTVDHYKSKTEEVKLLKKDFKQKEDKFLEEFFDLKKIKDKIEDRLYKQGQSAQTVHMLCQPKSFYDEKHKVAIGYKRHAQSAVYNGHMPVTTNHTPTVIHDSEDTRELAEITRKRMLLKMQSPLCVENKIRISPPDYAKENLLATFAPQRNLTPEQIFWSIDDNNRKKAETLALKPISALTVYPPNTPVKLVPRILPTKSQVKINLYVLTQLFTEFDKTCKTRITPSGLTEGERGFEQTKRCYLTEVIPFFKTLKEHFVGVQTALFKEVKEMEEIFDQMNNEVDKNTVDKQCAEIEKKNLLIENENLIVNCLSTQLLYDVEKSRCLDLEADMSKVHDESKLISKLEREYLNLQLKYQHLQESFDNKNSQASQEAPDFNSFFKIKNLEHQIQEKDNVIRNLKVLVANVNDRSCEPYNAKDVTALIEQNDCDRVELEKVKQHYKELYDSIKITRAHTSEKTSTMLNEIESLKAQLRSKEPCFTSDYVKPKVLAPGMYAIDVKPIPHPLKNNRSAHLNYISHLKESVATVREIVEEARVVKPLDSSLNYACRYTKLSQELLECVIGTCPKSFNERDNKAPSTPVTRKMQENKKEVEVRLRTNKSVWTKVNRVDSSISFKRVVINSNSESVCKTCNKCVNSANHGMCVVNILNSVNATPTVRTVLNKEKQIWKPKGKLSDNSLTKHIWKPKGKLSDNSLNKTKQIWKPKGKLSDNSLYKTKQVWKATGKLFADIGYQWRPTGKKLTLGKLDCGSQWRPTGKKFALGEMCQRCSKHMTGNRSKLMNFVEKFIGSVRFGKITLGLSWQEVLPPVPNLKKQIWKYLHTLPTWIVCPRRVQSIKGKKYILVIVDDYSRFTWVKFLRSKDETPEFVTNFLKQIQVGLNKTVRFIRTDNGTEFVNQVMSEYYEGVGIFHQKSVPRTPQQNGVVERRNRTLVEAARTMMIFSKAPMFLWAEAVATALFGALCYPTNDSENLGKFQAKAGIGIFIGYAPSKKGYRIYNKKTRRLMEIIHVTFDEIHQSMAPVRMSSGLEPFIMTPRQLKSGLAPTDKELEMLFQPMFDEHLEQSRVDEPVSYATEINAQVVPPGTSLSTTIAQDAPSTSGSSSTSDNHSRCSSSLT